MSRRDIAKVLKLEDNCIFHSKPICKFPCNICKACWDRKGCMGCINPDKKYEKDVCNY